MSEITDYTDARTLLPDYEQHRCPDCGTIEWFKHSSPRYDREHWRCQNCSAYLTETLEYLCPECDVRMTLENGAFRCANATCDHDETPVDTDELVDRLSDDMRGMPRALMGECPLCNERYGVNGGPDGELVCRDCNDLYAGRYSDTWYCYAIWMEEPSKIRVNERE